MINEEESKSEVCDDNRTLKHISVPKTRPLFKSAIIGRLKTEKGG